MSFPGTYRAIDAMLRNMVKHTALARAIVRKAGVRLGSAGAIVEGSLQWLIDLWFARRAYNQPTATTFGSDEGNGPYSLLKSIPKKASSTDYDIIYQNDTTDALYGSQATYDIFEARPTFWGMGGEYGVGANLDDYPGDPAYLSEADRFNNAFEDYPFITGSETYDPFPYPEYPNHFWADLRHVTHMYHFYSLRIGGMFLGDAIEGDDRVLPRRSPLRQGAYVWFELHASLDGGETWEGPYDQEGTFSSLPYYGGDSFNVNPNAPDTSKTAYYMPHGERDLRNFGGNAYLNNIPTNAFPRIKNRFRVNDVLMKFVLRGADPDAKIYIGHYGVRALCPPPVII